MSANDDGGMAFPSPEMEVDGRTYEACFGMTLRDYFAAKAMQSLVIHYSVTLDVAVSAKHDEIAGNSYMLADAMLKARES
jgi:hypothetical protein